MAFGEENVFYDVDSIPTGRDFRQVISNAIQAADAVVVMIGPGFDVDRLSNQRDFVRIELLEALRHNKVIVPVTVDATSMPEATALPASLKTLAYIHATPIRRDAQEAGPGKAPDPLPEEERADRFLASGRCCRACKRDPG